MKGQVISGELGKILIRQKTDQQIQLGELLVADGKNENILLQVYDLLYGSQIAQQNLELISGMHLEESSTFDFIDPSLRNYMLALAKPVLAMNKQQATLCKSLPEFFSTLRAVTKEDIRFLTKPTNALLLGKLRSGRNVVDVDVFLPGEQALTHHILIPATTGRGKSNLTSTMLWNLLTQNYCGILVLDPHDEYYGRTGIGLKEHSRKDMLVYYTPSNPPAGARSLKINTSDIKPQHFDGAVHWTDAQRQAVYAAYNLFHQNWIERILFEEQDEHIQKYFQEGTLMVVKRKLMGLLNLGVQGNNIQSYGLFDTTAGSTTVNDICDDLENSKVVVVDTSTVSGATEIIVGSIISSEMLKRYRNYKRSGELKNKPVISIVLEEAPRVLGKDVLQHGSNIFDTIAREGRKFKIGLVAITQLPSAIPRSILANMNTKIILGLEMKPERDAIIDSASQDLSSDSRNIASLDKGEAIVTSNFTKFAIPIKIPLFKDVVAEQKAEPQTQREFSGISN
jgi:uncharacterized protein